VVRAVRPVERLGVGKLISPLGGYQAVADILGTTRQAVMGRWKRMQKPATTKHKRSDFPRPATITPRGPLWNLDEVREYARRKKLGKYKKGEVTMGFENLVHQLDNGKWTVGEYNEQTGTWSRPTTAQERERTGASHLFAQCGRDVNKFAAYHGPQLASKQSAIRFAKRVYEEVE